MIKSIKAQEEVFTYHRYCDVCGAEITHSLACTNARCMYCKKDLCEKCIGHEEGTSGDYRDVWCKRCWDIGSAYRPKIEAFEAKVQLLYQEWQSKCRDKEKEEQEK